ncbi:hypothetical protein FACS189445_7010 [Spirochaetia bacterium]|nr:hypothetical protein FACS189445_7010 [Spirochaetia bacterium]
MKSPFFRAAFPVLWFFLAPFVFAADSADPQNPQNPQNPPPLPGAIAPAEAADEAFAEDDSEEDPLQTLESSTEDSPLDDLEMTIYYDDRNETDYVEIRTSEKIEEYHYLSHIKYADLIFVLSDLLRRITRDGYQWAAAPAISYEKSDEVVLLYRKDLVHDVVYGIVQFPDFMVWLSALRERDVEHRFNAGNGRDMMTLVFSFASCLAQAEQTLGINQLEYTMKFFKQD